MINLFGVFGFTATPALEYCRGLSVPSFFASPSNLDASTNPKPFFTWTFDDSLSDWTNDISNWHQKWKVIDGAVCLQNAPKKATGISPMRVPWQTKKKAEDKSGKATLGSPPIPHSVGMRCITLEYRISGNDREPDVYSLALLQQQDGYWMETYFVLRGHLPLLPRPANLMSHPPHFFVVKMRFCFA